MNREMLHGRYISGRVKDKKCLKCGGNLKMEGSEQQE